MSDTTEAQALADALGTNSETITINKNKTTIEPLCIDQISRVLLTIDRLAASGVSIDLDSKSKVSYTQLVLRGGKDFQEILAIASNLEPDAIGRLNILEAAKLAGAVWKVNKDFFDQNRIEILGAFGLDQSHIEELKSTFASIKSLVTSASAASPTSDDSNSPNASPSPTHSEENSDNT